MSGHLDTFVALAGIVAILISRAARASGTTSRSARLSAWPRGIKINAAFIGLGIAVPLIRERAWLRLLRTGAVAAAVTLGLCYFELGPVCAQPLPQASRWVIAPSIWRLVQMASHHSPAESVGDIDADRRAVAAAAARAGLDLYNRLSPDVPAVLAATCALTFAWVLVAPLVAALVHRAGVGHARVAAANSLTRWLTLVTGAGALLHFNAGHPTNPPVAPAP